MTTRQRPAVVVSTSAYAQARPDVVLMAVTSQVRSTLAFAETLLIDWQAAKLLKASVVKPLLAALEQSLIIKQLGTLSSSDQAALEESLAPSSLSDLWRR